MIFPRNILKIVFLLLSFSNIIITADISDELYHLLIESSEYSKICACISYRESDVDPSSVKTKCNLKINELVSYKCSDNSNFEILKVLEHEFNYFGLFKFSNRGYIGVDYEKKRLILSFSGSKTWVDWIVDLTIPLVPFKRININEQASKNTEKVSRTFDECCSKSKYCKVHKGFYHSAKSLFTSHESIISEFLNDNPNYQFWITGHSLGGAMALLSGLEYKLNNYNPILITAGSPKVGNSNFNHLVNSVFDTDKYLEILQSLSIENMRERGVYIRLIHKGDSVPRLPLGGNGYGYEHSGIALYIDKKHLPHEIDDVFVQNSNFQEDVGIESNIDTFDDSLYFEDDYENYSEFINSHKKDELEQHNDTGVLINKIPRVRREAHANYFITVTSCKNKST